MEIGVANLALYGDDHGDTFPLLNQLLEDLHLPEVLERFLLPALDPTTLALLARAGTKWRAIVVSSGLPRAGCTEGLPLKVSEFCGSVELLAWVKANGCPWDELTCGLAAAGGYIEVLSWARGHDCPWDARTCAFAALGGLLDVLRWAHEHHCPWDVSTCAWAAAVGNLDVLRWSREHHCPWDVSTCTFTALHGHLDVLRWAREHHCPWGTCTCSHAARGGHLNVLKWAREHQCPWDEWSDVCTCCCVCSSRGAEMGNGARCPCQPGKVGMVHTSTEWQASRNGCRQGVCS